MSREFLATDVTSRTLSKHFDHLLQSPPRPRRRETRTEVFIKTDAQYLSHYDCIILVKEERELIYWQHFQRETFQAYLIVFSHLQELGYDVIGVTSDWHGSIVGAVKHMYGDNIPHQRCLVHIQRRCQSLLTKNPKSEAGKQLLELVKFLNKISNKYEKQIWIKWFEGLEERHGDFITERTYGVKEDGSKTWWYTHKNVRAAYRSIRSSIDHLFLYLEHENLDKDTNGIESEFSHLKQKINVHRGLKLKRKIAAIYWYFYFVNQRRN